MLALLIDKKNEVVTTQGIYCTSSKTRLAPFGFFTHKKYSTIYICVQCLARGRFIQSMVRGTYKYPL